MNNSAPSYCGHRFPPEIISHAVWLYHRFCLSFRDVEDLLAERGVTVSYEAIRQWCWKFGSEYARGLKRRQGRLGDTWHLDELFVTIPGPATVSVASGRPGWRPDLHPRPGRSESACSRTLLPQAVGRTGRGTQPAGDGQTAQLWRRSSNHHAFRDPRYEAVRQQPSGGLPSADPATRTTDAPVQVARPSAALPLRSRSHPEPLPGWTAPRELGQPPYSAGSFLRRLASGDVCLLNRSDTFDGAASRFDEDNLTVPLGDMI